MKQTHSDRMIIALAVVTAIAIGATMPFAFAERGGECAEAEMVAEMERQLRVINSQLDETAALQRQVQQVSDPRLARKLELAALASETEALLAQLMLSQQIAAGRWICKS